MAIASNSISRPLPEQNYQPSFNQRIFTGLCTSSFATVACQPPEVMMTYRQTGDSFKNSLVKALSNPYRGGILSLGKRGISQVGIFATKPFFEKIARNISSNDRSVEAISGCGGGVFQALVTNPLSTLSVRKIRADQNHCHLNEIVQDIPRKNLRQILCAGTTSNVIRKGTYWGIYFPLRQFLIDTGKHKNIGEKVLKGEQAHEISHRSVEPNIFEKAVSGGVAAMPASAISMPFDVISKIQKNSKPGEILPLFKQAKVLLNQPGGIQNFYRGLSIQMPLLAVAGASVSLGITFSDYVFSEKQA
ncbi:MAG: hypothetical protein ACI9S8_001913 [Chlamydiales bacterium]|jgi:hypothetical protein